MWIFQKSKAIIEKVKGKSGEAYRIAKAGGRHSGILKTYSEKPIKQLEKAVSGYEKQVAKHLDKIANPSKPIPNWAKLTPERQQQILRGWQQDIERNRELVDVMKGIIEERGK